MLVFKSSLSSQCKNNLGPLRSSGNSLGEKVLKISMFVAKIDTFASLIVNFSKSTSLDTLYISFPTSRFQRGSVAKITQIVQIFSLQKMTFFASFYGLLSRQQEENFQLVTLYNWMTMQEPQFKVKMSRQCRSLLQLT